MTSRASRRARTGLVAGALVAGCSGPGTDETRSAWFDEQAQSRGIDFTHHTGAAGRWWLPEITPGGVALVDVDGDDDLDLYFIQSGSLVEEVPAALGNKLYLNRGDGHFEPAPESHGAADTGYGQGVATGDYDNDGDVDLYVTNAGPNVLLRNDGNGRFEDVTAVAGVGDPGFGSSAAFIDLDRDGDLDLYLANYVNWSPDNEIDCYVSGLLAYCAPQNYEAPAVDRLYRNEGDGTFTDMTDEVGLERAFGNGLGVVGDDVDGNGFTDVFVANDMTYNQLWLNQGDWKFDEAAMLWGCAMDGLGSVKAGMGTATADVDDDGDFDLFVVNFEGQTDSLFRNEGTWFSDATTELGLGLVSRRFTRFGVVFADFDNDGRLDLYEANGAVEPGDVRTGNIYREPNLLFRGVDGGFEEVLPIGGTIESLIHTSRGLAAGDLNDDGALDLVVANRDGPAYLLMNQVGGRGNWIRFRIISREARDAHAAVVSANVGAKRLYRKVQPEGSYLSSNDPRVHFGLGYAERATEVTVRWPTGEVELFGDFEAGRTVVLNQGTGTARVP